ncbi:protein translocase subunit SecF [candidate division WOR-3 bacterium]|nr:protein translocase subunit SecF [candidate division WOR-3 bacterium]
MRLIPDTRIDFVGKRRLLFGITGALALAAIALVVFVGFRFGVDFTGGSRFQIHFDRPVGIEAMRSALAAFGDAGAAIQQDQQGDFIVRMGGNRAESDPEVLHSSLRAHLASTFATDSVAMSGDSVGPQVSKELKSKVLLAVVVGLIGILIYVSFRFDFRFGLSAVLSLLFVTLVALGFVCLTRIEVTITVIAAILTVIGYGVNDSIVVSDRIREDVKKMRKEPFNSIVNKALNETLSRTVITGLSTLMVLVAMLLLGAASIKDFAAVMLVGLFASTYSSIFVVANTVVEWEARLPTKGRR